MVKGIECVRQTLSTFSIAEAFSDLRLVYTQQLKKFAMHKTLKLRGFVENFYVKAVEVDPNSIEQISLRWCLPANPHFITVLVVMVLALQ